MIAVFNSPHAIDQDRASKYTSVHTFRMSTPAFWHRLFSIKCDGEQNDLVTTAMLSFLRIFRHILLLSSNTSPKILRNFYEWNAFSTDTVPSIFTLRLRSQKKHYNEKQAFLQHGLANFFRTLEILKVITIVATLSRVAITQQYLPIQKPLTCLLKSFIICCTCNIGCTQISVINR